MHCYTESCKRSETRLPFAALIKHGFPLLSTTGPGKKSLEFELPIIRFPSSPSMAVDSVGPRTQPHQSLGSEVSSSGKTVQSERSHGACDPDEIITQFCRRCIESKWWFLHQQEQEQQSSQGESNHQRPATIQPMRLHRPKDHPFTGIITRSMRWRTFNKDRSSFAMEDTCLGCSVSCKWSS